MMNDVLYIANNRWIVETLAPMWKEYEELFDTDHPNLVEPGKSTTVNGYQVPHTLEETKGIANFIIEKTNSELIHKNNIDKQNELIIKEGDKVIKG